jgi:hypothetical protein
MKGKVKKVITISTGHADLELVNNLDIENSALYAASKAAMNIIVAKYSAQYKKDGVLFVSISPGVVEVGHFANSTYPPLQDKNIWTFSLMIRSHSRTDTGFDGVHGQACNLCPSLQRPNARRRSCPSCQIDLGEGWHRQWVWGCIYFAFWKQEVVVNLKAGYVMLDIFIDVSVRYMCTSHTAHPTRPSYMICQ